MNPIATRALLRNLTTITHLVPAERVRSHIPRDCELEIVRNASGEELAFISFVSFLVEGFHWELAPRARLNFHQATYRTYVRFRGREAVYFFATFLNTDASYLLQRVFAKPVYRAQFAAQTSYDEIQGYSSHRVRLASEAGWTRFSVRAESRRSATETTRFITDRGHGLMESAAGILLDQTVRHSPMRPWVGELKSGRFELWERLGFLEREGAGNAASVLIEPEVQFTFYPPFPARLLLLPNEEPAKRAREEAPSPRERNTIGIPRARGNRARG